MGTQQVNIRLDTDLIKAYEEMAKDQDRDRTYVMRKALEANLDQSKRSKAVAKSAGKSTRFVPPTLAEAQDLFLKKGSSADEAGSFINFYESKGWMVGKSKMKSWTAAAAKWIKRSNKPQGYLTAQEKRAERNSEIFDYDSATTF